MSKLTKVITYQSPSGQTINLTPAEIKAHTKGGTWPRDSRGALYCSVSHGLHKINAQEAQNDL